MAGILHEQGFDVIDVTADLLIVRSSFQRDQCARNNIDKAPGKLLERSGIALVGQLIGDTGGNFGDTREIADRIIARGQFRKAQMKQVEIVQSTCTLGLRVDAAQ